MKKNHNKESLTLLAAAAFSLTMMSQVFAMPAGHYQLHVETGEPKRNGETAFSLMAAWSRDDEAIQRANGLTFINGTDNKKPTSDVEVARKISNSLNAGIAIKSPHDRGAVAKNSKDKPELLISNKTGFDIAYMTVRDYSNQRLSYSLPGKSFQSASVKVAIDLVYSAAVEYVDGFSSGIKKETAGGKISVVIDDKPAIEIQTKGKSTKDLEKELADALGSIASYSSSPYYPNFVELRSKNYKAFDGGEVHFPALSAKSITINVNDSGLGVLTKFDFPEAALKKAKSEDNTAFLIGLVIAAGGLGWFFFLRKPEAG